MAERAPTGVATRDRARVGDLPLRVALFAEQGHPRNPFRSGVTRLTEHLVRGCRRRGVELDYFTYHPEGGTDPDGCIRWHRTVPRLGIRLHGLEVDALDLIPLTNPRLRDAAAGRTYDVVLATSPGIGTQGQLLARRLGIPFAAVYTTDLPNYAEALVAGPGTGNGARAGAGRGSDRPTSRGLLARLAGLGAWRYLAWLYRRRRTDLVLVPTENARRDFVAHVPARAQVLGRGADTLSFPEVREDRRAPGEPVRLLYVGRVDYGEKNLAVLEHVLERLPGVELTVVGDGDDLDLMQTRLAGPAAEGRVRFTGRVRDADRLRALYLSSDVFVFPSIYDTLGQVVLEAQKAGLPVVVRDRGGPPELVRDRVTGFVTSDDEAFVDRVSDLVDDVGLRRAMGRAARGHADALPGWTDIIDDLLDRLAGLARRDGVPRETRGSVA